MAGSRGYLRSAQFAPRPPSRPPAPSAPTPNYPRSTNFGNKSAEIT